ncbi:hypothetical protein [Haliangium ochraceum]|uniref:Uncharacterized protein n=1 Tax=Haliangium ochraceum (strain DSM 14365 / JCM 11303 / SMP-2) TaxID=502025 RepID=D0LP21_HALO1|nr:hypothetical protein [Haliangium ochraceum]ACY18847.1 hypothetical protein Hoch_6377 [Haliangium ochraceum DSM 14365]
MSRWGALAALGAALALAWGCSLPPLSNGVLSGTVMLGTPVVGAQVRVYRLDVNGAPKDRAPVAEAVTDEMGRFYMELGASYGNLHIESTGGRARELWTEEPLELGAESQLVAVIPAYEPYPPREIVVSPFTTIAATLAEHYRASADDERYHEAVQRAHALLSEHLGDLSILDTAPAPISEPAPQLTPSVRHGLLLASLSLLAGRIADETAGSVRGVNTMALTEALRDDASDAAGLLDGIGPRGALELGLCAPPPECSDCRPLCRLSAQTLRQDLGDTLAFHLLGSVHDGTGLDFGDGAAVANHVAQGTEAALFGAVEPGAVRDEQGPIITPLESPYFNESEDVIAFDPALQPVHVRSNAARVDLASVFQGDCAQELHKHVSLLGPDDDNPLRWRFAVRDAAAGFVAEDVSARIRVPGLATPRTLTVTELPGDSIAGGRAFEARALKADVAALAAVEGRYNVEITATDRLGNPSDVLRGCWEHVPRAAPLWAGTFGAATGAGSFDETRLENDNLAPVLRGDQAPILARLEVQNNTDADAYLTFNIDELTGRYSATWVHSRALLSIEPGASDCLTTGACNTSLPPAPAVETLPPQTLPASMLTLRVVDKLAGQEPSCPTCRPNENHLGARGQFEVQALVADLAPLVAGSVIRTQISEIHVGRLEAPTQLTGVDRGIYVRCSRQHEMTGECQERITYQQYSAITGIFVSVDTLAISALASASPVSTPQKPQPPTELSTSTLSTPLATAVTWETRDEVLPDPG